MLSAVARRISLDQAMPWVSRLFFLAFVVVLVGLMPEFAGIDPSQSILRARSGHQQLLTAEALQSIRDELQLDRSTGERLWDWLSSAMQGDLGTSWVDGSPVIDGIQHTASTSFTLMASALALTVIFCSIAFIYTMVSWHRGRLASSHNSLSSVLVALPEYVIAAMLILVFAIWLQWLPPYGWVEWKNLWLPSLALALPASGLLSRLLSDSLKRVLSEPWVITWLSANISIYQITLFALKRAMSNLIPQFSMVIIGLTGGAVAVEVIFSIPGIGRMLLGAAKSQDLPILQGGLLVLLVFSITISCIGILLQKIILGKALSSGKLIGSQSSFSFTKNKWKRLSSFSIFVVLFVFVGIATLNDPYTSQFGRLVSPSLDIPLGSDAIGRDLFARVGTGMLSTLQGGILATVLSLFVGIALGLCTRYSQGLIEITKGLPYIIVGLLVAGLTGMSPYSALIAIVVTSWAPLAAHCSSLLLEAKAQPYVHLAPTWGVRSWDMYRHYLLPYVLPPLLRHALLRLPVITLSLTSLSFIGLGVKPPEPEWGILIAENLPYIERSPFGVVAPILGLVLLGIAVNLMFDV
ncbi:ABC transporter permease subunit [Vibrio breoganii]|uniref:ABC transporter permease subunit n=1 Tax=Vibrio breoganii TaxID=553239 RepID=UPI0021C41CF6|nr:ABC transporter permease subunit [Vibrio breoganii]MDN3717665.1 ABC transporter permease subunit [Vibrio breoganii]